MFRGPNAIIARAHGVYRILKIIIEFMEAQFTKPHSELGQIGLSYKVMNPKSRFNRTEFGDHSFLKNSNR